MLLFESEKIWESRTKIQLGDKKGYSLRTHEVIYYCYIAVNMADSIHQIPFRRLSRRDLFHGGVHSRQDLIRFHFFVLTVKKSVVSSSFNALASAFTAS